MKKVIILVAAAVFSLSTSVTAQSRKNLWFVGDGAMASYVADSTDARGWGQMFEEYLMPKAKLVNDAKLGMSLKVFFDNEGVAQIEKQRARTIMFFQLGTNDLKEYSPEQHSAPDAFIQRIKEIISVAHQNRVNVVLCTPLAQPFYKDGELIDRLGSYVESIRHLAAYYHLALLDLEQSSREWLQSMTEEEAAQYYVTLDKKALVEGEYQLNEAGAKVVAEMARQAILDTQSKKLQKILKK